jgi:hypothetical protein
MKSTHDSALSALTHYRSTPRSASAGRMRKFLLLQTRRNPLRRRVAPAHRQVYTNYCTVFKCWLNCYPCCCISTRASNTFHKGIDKLLSPALLEASCPPVRPNVPPAGSKQPRPSILSAQASADERARTRTNNE